MKAEKDSVLVLGSSSWIGHYLLAELQKVLPSKKILAGYSSNRPSFLSAEIDPVQISSKNPTALQSLEFHSVVHLARGEEEEDFRFLQMLIHKANQCGGRVLYASSANALDGSPKKVHLETDLALGSSPYGKFKAQCENEVLKSAKKGLVFRFSAIHGFAPNRKARTQEFLEKLKRGEEITIPRGIIQNRLFVGDLASMIAQLLAKEETNGIWHLGTIDQSEEFHFCQRLAKLFGYEEKSISPGKEENFSLVVRPQKFLETFPQIPLPTEEDSLQKVRQQPELQLFTR